MEKNSVHQINSSYWDTIGNEYLGAIVLPLYGPYISEEKCRFFGDVSEKKVLEIGCGNGRSLQYLGERKAAELWGIDLSQKQIEKAEQHLTGCGLSANLICAPMEEECGIPADYFDYVYSVYAIGWTTDLEGTFRRIASYLKKGGAFIFSWSHPIHKCVVKKDDGYIFQKCYFDESWYSVPFELCKGALALSDRKLSTYVNALAKAGFMIEKMIEEPDDAVMRLSDENSSNSVKRAKMLPVTFVMKAIKL